MKILPFDLNTTSTKPSGKQEYIKPVTCQSLKSIPVLVLSGIHSP